MPGRATISLLETGFLNGYLENKPLPLTYNSR